MVNDVNIALNLSNVSVERNGLRVVQGIDLSVRQGAWFSLIGANGSGKTSLLSAVGGRLQFSDGSCVVEGNDLVADRGARATYFGFALPPETLPDSLHVKDALGFVGGTLDRAVGHLGELYNVLNLSPLLDRWIGDCSAGMRQRVALALAFANGQSFIILDEPFNWLDPVTIFDLRVNLQKMVNNGMTLLTAMHDLPTFVSACDAGVILSSGRVVMELDEAELREGARNLRDFEEKVINMLRAES